MNLFQYRLSQSLSVNEAAASIGVTGVAYRYWERGLRLPSKQQMQAIYLWSNGNVTPNDFYELPNLHLSQSFAFGCKANCHKRQENNSVKPVVEEAAA